MRVRTLFLLIALSTLLFCCSLTALAVVENGREIPEVAAVRINPHAPSIDGNLDDAIWQKNGLPKAQNFIQRIPDEGQPATESTLVAIVYDDEAIYFGVWNFDSEPDAIQKQLVRRDRYSEADKITIRLDPYHDHQTGFEFTVNASGVQQDARIVDDSWTDTDWDGVWESAVRMQPWGWSVEIKIPYHCLRFPEKEEHTWGVDFMRWINRRNEGSRWSFTPQSEGGFTSNFGHITGLSGITPVRHLEVLPYAVSSIESEPTRIGNPDGRDYYKNVGFDLKYGLSSNLTLNATFNPDFGQVELDQPVLNLSAFETWFPEKRPFFLEGSDMFDTRFSLFYSRRVGRPPQGGIDDDEYAYTTDRPKATSILSAAKLSGKLSSGTTIAFLNAVTEEEGAEYSAWRFDTDTIFASGGVISSIDTLLNDTVGRKQTIEPLANYSVLRVKQDIFNNSNVGLLVTNASQDTYHPATTGGVDWRLRTNDNDWGFGGQVVASQVDNEHTGFGMCGEIEKASGEHFRGSVFWTVKDPHLQINRLGFTSRNDTRHVGTWAQYRTQDPWWIIRRTWNNFNAYFAWNYDGYNIEKGGNINAQFEFMNYWSLGWGITMQADEYSDHETRGNGIWEWPQKPTYSWWASLNTDSRKKLSFNINPGSGTDREGDWWANYMGLNYRPASNIELSAGCNYHRTFKATRWVTNDDDRAIFATMDRDQLTPRLSASVVLRRNLSFQVSAQTLIAGISHRDYREYNGNKSYTPLDPVEDADLIADLAQYNNYNYSAINSTMIMRWEYMPGSTLYLVWTRARGEVDYSVNDMEVSRDLKRFFSSGSDNVFLVKASYWWNI